MPTTEFAAFQKAAKRAIEGHVVKTPLIRADSLCEDLGNEVWLKCENLQRTGSFKVRGAVAAIDGLSASQREAGVVAVSTGNHGKALAWAAQQANVPCSIVVPQDVVKNKAQAISNLGAKLVVAPMDGYDQAQAWAFENMKSLGRIYISAFEHPAVVAGNGGTVGEEIFASDIDFDAILAPCGGGGLAGGIALYREHYGKRADVIAVQPEASPGMWLSLRDGRAHLELEPKPTLSDGTAGGIGEDSFVFCRDRLKEVLLVDESAIRRAMLRLMMDEKLVSEGAGALGVAAAITRQLPYDRICIVVTGGNVDQSVLADITSEE